MASSTGQWQWVRRMGRHANNLVATADGGATILTELYTPWTLDTITVQPVAGQHNMVLAHCNAAVVWKKATVLS